MLRFGHVFAAAIDDNISRTIVTFASRHNLLAMAHRVPLSFEDCVKSCLRYESVPRSSQLRFSWLLEIRVGNQASVRGVVIKCTPIGQVWVLKVSAAISFLCVYNLFTIFLLLDPWQLLCRIAQIINSLIVLIFAFFCRVVWFEQLFDDVD